MRIYLFHFSDVIFCTAFQRGGTHPICWLTTENVNKTKVYEYQIGCFESTKLNLFEVTARGRPTPQNHKTREQIKDLWFENRNQLIFALVQWTQPLCLSIAPQKSY